MAGAELEGWGKRLSWKTLTENIFQDAVDEMLNKPEWEITRSIFLVRRHTQCFSSRKSHAVFFEGEITGSIFLVRKNTQYLAF